MLASLILYKKLAYREHKNTKLLAYREHKNTKLLLEKKQNVLNLDQIRSLNCFVENYKKV
jgi:hypothetical protein